MNVKLSELLGDIVRTLEDSEWVSEINNGETLRVIAPALVEIAQALQQFSELHGGIESTHIPDYCPACRLVCAMKEAGVTCE